jgi:hypothetical protein
MRPATLSLTTPALVTLFAGGASAQSISTPAYCRVATPGTEIVAQRPASSEAPIDDVNWFARPVPNPGGRYIVGFASYDQNYLYIANRVPKNTEGAKRFTLRVVNPDREVRFANMFQHPPALAAAEAIGQLWSESCAPDMEPFKKGEAPWAFMSLSREQCVALVNAKFQGDASTRRELTDVCQSTGGGSLR